MKPTNYMTKGVALAALATGLSLAQFEVMAINKFEYSNIADTEIRFTGLGGTADIAFNTSPTAGAMFGANFKITGSDPAGSSAIDFYGTISGTSFTLGAGATVAPITSVGGKIVIYDGPLGTASPNYLTADLDWMQLENFIAGPTSIGSLGLSGNLSNFVTTGVLSSTDLIDFASGGPGTRASFLTYLLTPAKTLDQLRTLGADNHTSYSGVLAVVPEASDAGAVAGAAILGLGIYAQIRRRRAAAAAAPVA